MAIAGRPQIAESGHAMGTGVCIAPDAPAQSTPMAQAGAAVPGVAQGATQPGASARTPGCHHMTAARDQQLPWCRLYTAMLDDDKMLLLCKADCYVFVQLMLLKCKGVLDSDAPMRELRIARAARIPESEIHATMQRLIDVGLIDEQWHPRAWGKRQFASDATGADRTRKWRKRHSDNGVTSRGDKSDAPDTETESETESESDTPPADGGSAEGARLRTPRARPSRRMPANWMPSPELLTWAASMCPLVDFAAELITIR